jgi:Family of unknown function (DUF6506)
MPTSTNSLLTFNPKNRCDAMALQAAFIFLADGAEPATHQHTIKTPQVELHVVGVANYAQAEAVATTLLQEGVVAIELCGGFGVLGTARITHAVNGKAAVGVVRFDGHPGLQGRSGDAVFGAA